MKRDIHGHERKYALYTERIQQGYYPTIRRKEWVGTPKEKRAPKRLDVDNQATLLEFIDRLEKQLYPKRVSRTRIIHYLRFLGDICEWLGQDFSKHLMTATNEDLKTMLRDHVENNPKYAEWTRHDYRVTLSKFYRTMVKTENNATPDQLIGIPTAVDKRKIKQLSVNSILTPEEVQRLIQSAHSTMLKAAIAVLFEGGFRVSEFLSLTYSSVSVKHKEANIDVSEGTKTGARSVALFKAVPVLVEWLNLHPTKNPTDPLWVSERYVRGGRIRPLNYANFQRTLKQVAVNAGITKNVYPHLLRHSIASFHVASGVPPKVLCMHMGWSTSSNMPDHYSKISNKQVRNSIRKSLGEPVEEETSMHALDYKNCPDCGALCHSGLSFCKCGVELSSQNMDKKKEEMLGLLKELLKSENREIVIQALEVADKKLKGTDLDN